MEHDSHATPTSTGAPKRRTPWNTVSARVISLVSRKGGVGKTTSTVNLGAALALSGHTVLIVGVDPQCGVSRSLGYAVSDLDDGLLSMFDRNVPLTHLAHTSTLKNLFFVSPRISCLEEEERFIAAMHEKADHFVAQIDRARNLYDTILIDCPPGLSQPTRAALLASDSYLVPVQAEELCRDSVGPLIGSVDAFRDRVFSPSATFDENDERPLEIEGIFLTMVNDRTRMSRHVSARVASEFGPVMFAAAVPRTTRLSEMALRGKPAVIYDRRSAGSRAYFDLADEVVMRYCEKECVPTPDTVPDTPELPDERDALPRATALSSLDGTVRAVTPTGGALGGGGLDRLLGELRASGALRQPVVPMPDEFSGPDMLSLDDLLAEEERGEKDGDWDEGWTNSRFN